MKTLKVLFGMTLAVGLLLFSGCGDDDATPKTIQIVTITAAGTDVSTGNPVSGIDLNGATSAENIPVENLVITITFDKDVDATSVSGTTVTISDGTTQTGTTSAVAGAVVTSEANDDLDRGTDYTVTISGLMADDGGTFTMITRSFKTGGVAPVNPPNASDQEAYWNFDGNTDDLMGNYSTASETLITYVADRHGQAESSVSFDGDASLIEVAGADQLLSTSDFTLSFWMKSNSSDKDMDGNTRGQFVMGLAAWMGFQFEIFGNYGGCKLAAQYTLDDAAIAGQDLWWSTTGDLGWMGWTFDKDVSATGGLAGIVADKWAHVVCTYDATTKIGAIYMNGELVKSQDYNLYGDTHPLFRTVGMGYAGNPDPGNTLAFGFIQGSENRIVGDDWANPVGFPDNNHFKGELDDVRIFHAAFSTADVEALYDAEKP